MQTVSPEKHPAPHIQSGSPVPDVLTGRKVPGIRTPWIMLLVFLGPNLIGFLTFTFFPVMLSFFMAFTNWSIKPAVKLKFIGLRNFTDMLGVTVLEPGHGGVALLYLVFVLFCMGGLIGILGTSAWNWCGKRLGGLGLIGLGGILLLGGSFLGGTQGVILVGIILIAVGGFMVRSEDADWRPGWASLTPILLAVGCGGLWYLHQPMWRFFELRDERFYYYFYNTLYLMIGIPFTILGSLALALLLNDPLPFNAARQRLIGFLLCMACGIFSACLIGQLGQPNLAVVGLTFWLLAGLGFVFGVITYRTVFYLPSFTSGVALMILWKALYNPQTGPINVALEALCNVVGIPFETPNWLASVLLAKPALIVMGFWIGIGGMNMLLYLAALSNMPKDLIDAANVDGAGAWMRLRHVIWPQLAPTTFFIAVMSIIGGMQGGFEQARVMTFGGPAGSTTTLSYYIYTLAFVNLDLGYASAVSWVLFAIIFLATVVHWKMGKNIEVE